MVDFRITWTLQIGEVRKPRLPVGYNTELQALLDVMAQGNLAYR